MQFNFVQHIKENGKELNILADSHEKLSKRCKAAEKVDDDIRALAANMGYTMIKKRGIGIAANQVGENIRMLCMVTMKNQVLCMVNPKIVTTSKKQVSSKEGCLSSPGRFFNMKRYNTVLIKYTDLNNNQKQVRLQKRDAICAQHEIDHLDGKLISVLGVPCE